MLYLKKCYLFGYIFLTVFSGSLQQCSSPLSITSSDDIAGTITSPNYPSSYSNDHNCEWNIDSGHDNKEVLIYIKSVSIESYYDYLKFYNQGSSFLRSVTGELSETTVRSSGRHLSIRFTSDHSVTYSGFQLLYASIWDSTTSSISYSCTSSLTASTNETDQLTLPNNPSSVPPITCQWSLVAPAGYFLSVAVLLTDLHQSRCVDDYIFVNDPSGQNHTICGGISNQVIITSSQTCTIKYQKTSASPYQYPILLVAFSASNSSGSTVPAVSTTLAAAVSSSTCTGIQQLQSYNSSSAITSPSWPLQYSNNLLCKWQVVASDHSSRIFLNITEFNIESGYDSLAIYDGPNENYNNIGIYSGFYSAQTLITTGTYAFLTFNTDSRNTYSGFRIFHSLYTAGPPTCTDGTPSNYVSLSPTSSSSETISLNSAEYTNNLDKYWLITKESDTSSLYIYVETFSVEYSSTCRYDYLKAYTGPCESSAEFLKICGTSWAGTTYTYDTGRYLLLHFHTDSIVTRSGFKIVLHYENYAVTGATNSSTDKEKDSVDAGAIVGFVLLSLFLVFIIFSVIFVIYKRCRKVKSTKLGSRPSVNSQKRKIVVPLTPMIDRPEKPISVRQKKSSVQPVVPPPPVMQYSDPAYPPQFTGGLSPQFTGGSSAYNPNHPSPFLPQQYGQSCTPQYLPSHVPISSHIPSPFQYAAYTATK